jgi:hypothetical protein
MNNPETPPGGLPQGVTVKHWGKMKPPSPTIGSRPVPRARPFGMPNTPFNPMTGKFLALADEEAVKKQTAGSVNPVIELYLQEHLYELVSVYMTEALAGFLASLPGYNAAAVQHLTNVTGDIRWVTTEVCE